MCCSQGAVAKRGGHTLHSDGAAGIDPLPDCAHTSPPTWQGQQEVRTYIQSPGHPVEVTFVNVTLSGGHLCKGYPARGHLCKGHPLWRSHS